MLDEGKGDRVQTRWRLPLMFTSVSLVYASAEVVHILLEIRAITLFAARYHTLLRQM